ncbi:hypothetical protein L914_04323 [Phytophthora nicotianae]|uniref:Uncharacterized protein n=1 Tax=Phytophthora nicotianae TaxID=4792 RepID=W2NTJ2_PHYNI|nr:hypothetical protein L914_04323 [Phytophthora nicotianae]
MVRKVWFQLVDGATRVAFTDIQTASVSSGGQVNCAFTPTEAFDDGKGQPLEVYSPIGLFGEVMRDALIVVVVVGLDNTNTREGSWRFLLTLNSLRYVLVLLCQLGFTD